MTSTPAWPSDDDWHHRLRAALAIRRPLLDDPASDVARLFHGRADGVDGLVIEKLGPVLVVQLHEGRIDTDSSPARHACAALAEELGCTAVYRKVVPVDRSTTLPRRETELTDPQPWCGTPSAPEFTVREHGLTYRVRPYDGYLTGLFLDHRENRRWLRAAADGLHVLNAFAYTCAHGVAAAAGGATEVVHVDLAKKSLAWGKRNLAANDLALARQRFICADIFDFYRRAGRQQLRFDVIILDPPTFSRARRPARVFSLDHDLDRLVRGALALLVPHGRLLLSVNHREASGRRLERAVRHAALASGRAVAAAQRIPLPEDFPGDPDYAKSFLFRVD